jgi:hypothetical protein
MLDAFQMSIHDYDAHQTVMFTQRFDPTHIIHSAAHVMMFVLDSEIMHIGLRQLL